MCAWRKNINLMINCSLCLPVQLWEAQKIKQVSGSPVICQPRLTAPPCIQASGLLAAWGWCHALCTQAIIHPDTGEKIFMPFRMSGTISGEDLCQSCSCFSVLSSFFNHFFARAGYVPFGTPIVSPIWKSYILIMHFMVMFGNRWNETWDLFCAKISSYSLVSSRSLAFFSQIRLWCLPLYGRYCNQPTYCKTIAFIVHFEHLVSTPVIHCNTDIVK